LPLASVLSGLRLGCGFFGAREARNASTPATAAAPRALVRVRAKVRVRARAGARARARLKLGLGRRALDASWDIPLPLLAGSRPPGIPPLAASAATAFGTRRTSLTWCQRLEAGLTLTWC
jgi:hypothetical protein